MDDKNPLIKMNITEKGGGVNRGNGMYNPGADNGALNWRSCFCLGTLKPCMPSAWSRCALF